MSSEYEFEDVDPTTLAALDALEDLSRKDDGHPQHVNGTVEKREPRREGPVQKRASASTPRLESVPSAMTSEAHIVAGARSDGTNLKRHKGGVRHEDLRHEERSACEPATLIHRSSGQADKTIRGLRMTAGTREKMKTVLLAREGSYQSTPCPRQTELRAVRRPESISQTQMRPVRDALPEDLKGSVLERSPNLARRERDADVGDRPKTPDRHSDSSEGSFALRPRRFKRVRAPEPSLPSSQGSAPRKKKRRILSSETREGDHPPRGRNEYVDDEAIHSGDEETSGSEHDELASACDDPMEPDHILDDESEIALSDAEGRNRLYDQGAVYRQSLLGSSSELDGPHFATGPAHRGPSFFPRRPAAARYPNDSDEGNAISFSEGDEDDEYEVGSFVEDSAASDCVSSRSS